MNKLIKAFRIVVLALLLISALTSAAYLAVLAETKLPVHNIDTGVDYTTIQEAINAGSTLDGHTIRVDAGTYFENVVINKSVSLIGENKLNTIIDGRALGSVINITASHVNVTGFTIRNSKFGYDGVYIDHSSDHDINQNIVENSYNGIYVYDSTDSNVTDNDVLNNEYGIHLYGSSNCEISGNNASFNMNGIHLDVSTNNTVLENRVSSNTGNGVYLYGSTNNTVTGNTAFSNQGRGIRLHYSSNNTLLDNVVLNNGFGIYLYGSGKNIISGNDASFNNESGMLLEGSDENDINDNVLTNNVFGIWLINSGSNTVSGNNVSSNGQYGARLWNSSNNVFFHNDFIANLVKNIEQPTNTSSLNLWDNGVEGNFWGDYEGDAINMEGIGNKPYIVDANAVGVYSQDSFPLMGQFFQFSAEVENRSYAVTVVSNSTISSFQYSRGSDNETNVMSFTVNGSEGTGFCLVCIPHVLVGPPYTVTVDQASPLSYTVVRTNGTHTWVYLTYLHSQHELLIKPVMTPEVPIWSLWWFWGVFGLVLGDVVLAASTVRYHRKVVAQTKVLQAYSPFVIAEALFKADIERRGLKIKEFEKKYGIKIQPKSTLEEIIRSMETKEKEEKN